MHSTLYIEHILRSRHCSRLLTYNGESDGIISCSNGAYVVVGKQIIIFKDEDTSVTSDSDDFSEVKGNGIKERH